MSDTNQPVTQQGLQEALSRFAVDIAAVVRAEVKAAGRHGQELTRTIETDRVTSLYLHAKSQNARLHTLETVAYDFGLRLSAIEERLLNLETRRQ